MKLQHKSFCSQMRLNKGAMHWVFRALETTHRNTAHLGCSGCSGCCSPALLTPNSSYGSTRKIFSSFSFPCRVKYNLLLSGILFKLQSYSALFFSQVVSLGFQSYLLLGWTAVQRLSTDFSCPTCFPTHYFTQPNYLTKVQFATLACVVLGPIAQRYVFYVRDDFTNICSKKNWKSK